MYRANFSYQMVASESNNMPDYNVTDLRELRVSLKQSSFGETLTNMRVLLLPPREFCSRCVSFEFR